MRTQKIHNQAIDYKNKVQKIFYSSSMNMLLKKKIHKICQYFIMLTSFIYFLTQPLITQAQENFTNQLWDNTSNSLSSTSTSSSSSNFNSSSTLSSNRAQQYSQPTQEQKTAQNPSLIHNNNQNMTNNSASTGFYFNMTNPYGPSISMGGFANAQSNAINEPARRSQSQIITINRNPEPHVNMQSFSTQDTLKSAPINIQNEEQNTHTDKNEYMQKLP